MKPRVSLVITDLDNTLYDWVAMWSAAFPAMLRILVEKSGISEEVLEREAKAIHEKHQTSEYAFLIESLPSLQAKHPGEDVCKVYADAIAAYRQGRDRTLALYPSVLETLRALRAAGVMLIGYTDSRAFYSRSRMQALGLDGILDYLYSPGDHELPQGKTHEMVRSKPAEAYEFKHTEHRIVPDDETKPNPDLLRDIITQVGGDHSKTIYVGDSLMKDIIMAQQAEVMDVFAEYGLAQDRPGYEVLRRVTHWTKEQVERERQLKANLHIHPTFTLRKTFGEVLGLFEFEAFPPHSAR
jgi:phosphoglycolate phosphatase